MQIMWDYKISTRAATGFKIAAKFQALDRHWGRGRAAGIYHVLVHAATRRRQDCRPTAVTYLAGALRIGSATLDNDALRKTTRVRWFLVFWLFMFSAVSYLDRVNISIAGGAIVDAYHLTDVQLGKVFSALVAGYALFQTVGGHLADRFGPRRV